RRIAAETICGSPHPGSLFASLGEPTLPLRGRVKWSAVVARSQAGEDRIYLAQPRGSLQPRVGLLRDHASHTPPRLAIASLSEPTLPLQGRVKWGAFR